MKNKLTQNWGLKLASIMFALVLWVIVTNINDPVIQYKVTNVPVRFTHTDIVTSQGKVYEVLDNTDVLDQVTITAARSIIDSLSDSNVVAVADFNDLTMQQTVNIKLSTNKYNEKLESIKGSFEEVKLKIEDKKTISLALRASTSGELSEGYLLGDITTDRNLVRISGPESVVSQIAKAGVDVLIAGFTNNISTDAEIKLYDADGQEVDPKLVTMNITTVKVNIEILQTKTVPLVYHVSGTPAEGYQLTGRIEGSVSDITIAGKGSVLAGVQAISVPEEELNVTGQTDHMMVVLDAADYLPNGISLADPAAGSVTVTVYIEPEVTESVTLKTRDIEIINVPAGYEAVIDMDSEEYNIVLRGLSDSIEGIHAQDIRAVIDVNELLMPEDITAIEPGKYSVEVHFELDQTDVRITDAVKMTIELTKLGTV